MTMKLISWNINRSSIKRLRRQLEALEEFDPDILALIEFGKKASRKPRELLREYGFEYAASSHEFLDDQEPLSSSECIASKWPFRVLNPTEFDVPYTQRIVSEKSRAPRPVGGRVRTGLLDWRAPCRRALTARLNQLLRDRPVQERCSFVSR